jgi:hypothetical protein
MNPGDMRRILAHQASQEKFLQSQNKFVYLNSKPTEENTKQGKDNDKSGNVTNRTNTKKYNNDSFKERNTPNNKYGVKEKEYKTGTFFEPVPICEPKPVDPSLYNQKLINKKEPSKTNVLHSKGAARFINIKNSFSIFVDLDDFVHLPIIADETQDIFEFIDANKKQSCQSHTKFVDTVTSYQEQPYCHLALSKVHEIIFIDDIKNNHKNDESTLQKAIITPIHDVTEAKNKEFSQASTMCDFVTTKMPLIIGEYKIEICIEEDMKIKEEIMKILDISKEVVLIDCKFVPSEFSEKLPNGTRKAIKGKLFIEGCVNQNIEYIGVSTANTKSGTNLAQFRQKIVLELMIELMQVQRLRVCHDYKGI